MNRASALWAAFGALGALLLLSSLGMGEHPVHRLLLMAATLCWCGCFAWTGPISESREK